VVKLVRTWLSIIQPRRTSLSLYDEVRAGDEEQIVLKATENAAGQ
jgi:hypothetical protein